jgi:predicted dehydrogenase
MKQVKSGSAKSDGAKTDSVRWGIVSTAQIGRWVFAPALRATGRGELAGVASRDRTRAAAFAADLEIPEVFASYDDLLWSDRVDAVYVPLPNSMHEEWAVRAMEHGKHVFCEKPLATSPEAAQRMVDAATRHGVLLMEAMVFRYHPQTLRLRRLLDAGAIGDLRHVDMRMGGPLPAGNIRWLPELGGGALQDIGCYVITVARWAAGAEPIRVSAAWEQDREDGVDRHIGMLLEFPGGMVANLFGSFDTAPVRGAHLAGSGGTLHIEQPTHPYEESSYTLTTPQATEQVTLNNGVRAFTPALDHFHDCLLDGAAPLLANTDAVATLRVMAAAAESARTGRTMHLDRIDD